MVNLYGFKPKFRKNKENQVTSVSWFRAKLFLVQEVNGINLESSLDQDSLNFFYLDIKIIDLCKLLSCSEICN